MGLGLFGDKGPKLFNNGDFAGETDNPVDPITGKPTADKGIGSILKALLPMLASAGIGGATGGMRGLAGGVKGYGSTQDLLRQLGVIP